MATSNEKQAARYLQDKDGNVRLYHGEHIDQAKQSGLVEPTGLKANGEPWNPVVEEGEQSPAEAASAVARANSERKAEVDARKAKEAEANRKAAEKAAADAPATPPTPDFKVEIVEPVKPKAGKK